MSDDTRVDARIVRASGSAAQAVLSELGPRSVTVTGPTRGAPAIEPGERVELVLSGDLVRGELRADGHLERSYEHESEQRYTIRFVELADFERLLATPVGRHFNRRGAYRVTPADDAPVRANLAAGGAEGVEAVLADVSATGCAVVAGEGPLAALEPSNALIALRLELPGDPRPIELVAELRYISDGESGRHLGLCFDELRTRGFDAAQDRVVAYVMRRQRELLRDKRKRERNALR